MKKEILYIIDSFIGTESEEKENMINTNNVEISDVELENDMINREADYLEEHLEEINNA